MSLVKTGMTGKQYAIMILIIIATILAMYYILWESDFALFKPQSWFRPEISQGETFFVSTYKLTTDNLYLLLGQKEINDIEVTSIIISGDAIGVCESTSCPQLIKEGEKGTFNIKISPPLEQKTRIYATIIVTYIDLKTGLSGKTDKIEFSNVEVT